MMPASQVRPCRQTPTPHFVLFKMQYPNPTSTIMRMVPDPGLPTKRTPKPDYTPHVHPSRANPIELSNDILCDHRVAQMSTHWPLFDLIEWLRKAIASRTDVSDFQLPCELLSKVTCSSCSPVCHCERDSGRALSQTPGSTRELLPNTMMPSYTLP
jgi:hypothetical protein